MAIIDKPVKFIDAPAGSLKGAIVLMLVRPMLVRPVFVRHSTTDRLARPMYVRVRLTGRCELCAGGATIANVEVDLSQHSVIDTLDTCWVDPQCLAWRSDDEEPIDWRRHAWTTPVAE